MATCRRVRCPNAEDPGSREGVEADRVATGTLKALTDEFSTDLSIFVLVPCLSDSTDVFVLSSPWRT